MNKTWYKEMAVYQIWPRSFCDSNGDGIGDLGGIISKLDYIKSLGVDAIWFSPLYPSPNADFGYDISDYKNISPDYGTLDEFKTLLDEAHKRDLKVIMDLVLNHTSSEHEWFKKSIEEPESKYHDYYFWRKGKNGKAPNNWKSTFQGSAWEYNEKLDEYYLHVFAKEQPDLNMDNPAVREEVKEIIRFWLDMGVDGFREDVITFISKEPGLPNGFPLPTATGIEHYSNGPRLREYLKEFADIQNEYGAFTVGEAPMMTTKRALDFITEGENQLLKTMFHFEHMNADNIITNWIKTPFSLKKLKKTYTRWQKDLYGKAWNALYLENHDQPRIINRYGSPKYRVESGKMLAAMYICQSGTPFIYQGQEIGMLNASHLDSIDKYVDVSSINTYALFRKLKFPQKTTMKLCQYASRDNARTPVQWDSSENAGFTSGTPWFSVNPNYKEINVADAEKDPNSILNFYRKLLKFRKEHEIVIYGDYNEYYEDSNKVFVYDRTYEGEKMLVICSFAEDGEKVTGPEGYDLNEGELVLSNYEMNPVFDNSFITRPYELRVYYYPNK